MKNRIIDFLAQGLRPSQIASIVGVTAGYVVQVSKDPSNAEEIADKREKLLPTLTDDKILTDKYMAAEHSLLKQIEDTMVHAEFRDLTRALEIVGNRQEKRLSRLTAPQPSAGTTVNVLNLTLPSHATLALPAYQMNENKEIIAIGSNTMTPLSTEGVRNLFDAASGRNLLKDQAEELRTSLNTIEAPADF